MTRTVARAVFYTATMAAAVLIGYLLPVLVWTGVDW